MGYIRIRTHDKGSFQDHIPSNPGWLFNPTYSWTSKEASNRALTAKPFLTFEYRSLESY